MAALEDKIIETAQKIALRFDEITYVEIGVGEGATLSAIASTFNDISKKWRAIGVELPNGYSFNRARTEAWASTRGLKLNFFSPNGVVVHPLWNAISVYFKDSQSFLTELWQDPIQFALIDGCHGKPCVILDFLALEAFVSDDAIVMFHDFGADQYGHYQPHCPSGLDVLGACNDLGLTNGKRKGWRFVGSWTGAREKGGWDMGVFERTKEKI